MEFDVSILIIGKICSGKSTLANDLSLWLNTPKCSFGRYLLNYAQENKLQTDRDALQALGDSLIRDDHSKFLSDVVIYSGSKSRKMIFEGVRHEAILQDIRKMSKNSLSIFLDVKEEIRLQRFVNREKDIDEGHKANDDFFRYSSHPVEQEVETLKHQCDFIISSNKSYRDFLKILGVSQLSNTGNH